MPDKGKIALPHHVAIIPDGNRRWAKAHGRMAWEGHLEGAKRVEEVSQAAISAGIKYLTVWGGSYDNLIKRSEKEIKVLDGLYRDFARRALEDKNVYKNEVRLRFLGEWETLLTPATVKVIREAEEKTASHSKFNLTYLIGYNGDREMLAAIQKIVDEGPSTSLRVPAASAGRRRITAENLKSHLWTAELPPVDLVIRTGGDAHLSTGFMMWDTRYSLLSISRKMWPDFGKKDFLKEIKNFSTRERRLGA